MAAADLSPDSVKVGQHKELSPKDYSLVIRTLDNNLIKKDLKLLTFLCADFFDDKKFLAKEAITAHDIFSQMKRNGTISNGNLTLLSQLMFLLGKKKLQREVFLSRNIVWKEGMETPLSKFRLMLFRLYQDTRTEDFDKMKQYCSLGLDQDIPRAVLERVTNALELFTVLIDNEVIFTNDVNYLHDVVKTLGSQRMSKLVTDYKETIPSKDAKHQDDKKLSELSNNLAQATKSFQDIQLSGGPAPKPTLNRFFSSSDTSYLDEKVTGPSLKRPSDILNRSISTQSWEENSVPYPVQSVEALAMAGKEQPNSTTAKTADIEKEIKDMFLPWCKEGGHDRGRLTDVGNLPSEDKSLTHPVQVEEASALGGKEQPNSTIAKTANIEKGLKGMFSSNQEGIHEIGRPSGTTRTSLPEPERDEKRMKISLVDVGNLPSEDKSLTHPIQVEEASAIEGKEQPSSTTAKTAEIEKELKDMFSFSQEESHEMGRPSGQHEGLKPSHTEGHGILKDNNSSLFPHLRFTKESLAALSDESGDASRSQMSVEEGATARPLGTFDNPNLNFTVRTEMEESQLNELKKSECSNNTSYLSNRESTTNNFQSVHHPPSDAYPMSHIPRGKCLLLTYDKFDDPKKLKDRQGNEKDVEALKSVFADKLQFKVEDHINLDYATTIKVIRKAASEDHKKYDCFVLIFCSHGDESAVFTSDGLPIQIQELLTPFKAVNCKSLAGKPKIFFINSCRREGIHFQEFVETNEPNVICSDGPGLASNMGLVPNEADFLIALSTVPGYSSAREKKNGTLYAQSLAFCLRKYCEKNHLTEILTKVNQHLNEETKKRDFKLEKQDNKVMAQVSPYINSLEKDLYFVRQ